MCYPHPAALVAQLVEHLICNQGVAGSNPAGGTILSLKSLRFLASENAVFLIQGHPEGTMNLSCSFHRFCRNTLFLFETARIGHQLL